MKRVLAASSLTFIALAVFSQGATRPVTEAEKAFCSKVLATCAKAIPPGPGGWEATVKPDTATPASVSQGAGGAPFLLSTEAAWRDPKKPILEGKAPPSNPKEDSLLSKQAELAGALGKASEKGDEAAMERIQKELDDIEAQLDKMAETKVPAASKKLTPAMPQDATLKVRIDVNTLVLPLPKGAKAIPPVAGCSAFRMGDESLVDPSETGATLVLIGAWSEKSDAGIRRVESGKRTGAKPDSVQAIAVRVEATPSRAKLVTDKMDWAALKALLSK
jgi:hypothetical protein